MNWKFIKWLSKQPKVKFTWRTISFWRGYFDSCEITINGKLMYEFYIHPEKSEDGFRANWIEKL